MPVTSTAVRWGTVADAVKEYGVGESTVRRWISEGRVRSEKVGQRRRRIDLNSLTDGRAFGPQLSAALAALDQSDVETIARVVAKVLPATDASASVFYAVWQTIGSVAFTHVKAGNRA